MSKALKSCKKQRRGSGTKGMGEGDLQYEETQIKIKMHKVAYIFNLILFRVRVMSNGVGLCDLQI